MKDGSYKAGENGGWLHHLNGHSNDGQKSNGDDIKYIEIARYSYRNPEGDSHHQTIRYTPKTFRQRRSDGNNGWIWNLDGVATILYRLPELIDANPDAIVFVAEGEKDVDNLLKLGLIATCNPMGAGKWKPEYSETLRGRRVCVIADKDAKEKDFKGQRHAHNVCASLNGIAAQVKYIELPGDGVKDASDWIDSGGTAKHLVGLFDAAPVWASNPFDAQHDIGLRPVKLGTLWESDSELREPIIDGLLRRGQVGNLISTSKSYKTYLILDLAIRMALKKCWLDRFPTVGGKVLIIDMELQRPDISRRTHDIANAVYADSAIISENVEIISLRGRNADIETIEKLLLGIAARTYSLVIVDPLYKTYPEKFDENSNSQMTMLYRRFERIAEHLDAGLMLVHHASKGSQAEKRVVDVGSGAGAQARSPDCHIALREHEVDNSIVFDARVRSFKPTEAIVLRWNYPLWERDLTLDPTKLKTGKKSRNSDRSQPQPAKSASEEWTVEKFTAEFITADPQEKPLIIAKARKAGIKNRQIDDLLALTVAEKQAFRWSFPKDRTVYIANIDQPLTYGKIEGASDFGLHTHDPPHPHEATEVPMGRVGRECVERESIADPPRTHVSATVRDLGDELSNNLGVARCFQRRTAIMPRGRPFQPGQSGNPSGRPAVIAEVRDLARQHTAMAVETLRSIASDSNQDARARVAAASAILDRGFGKPGQSTHLTSDGSLSRPGVTLIVEPPTEKLSGLARSSTN